MGKTRKSSPTGFARFILFLLIARYVLRIVAGMYASHPFLPAPAMLFVLVAGVMFPGLIMAAYILLIGPSHALWVLAAIVSFRSAISRPALLNWAVFLGMMPYFFVSYAMPQAYLENLFLFELLITVYAVYASIGSLGRFMQFLHGLYVLKKPDKVRRLALVEENIRAGQHGSVAVRLLELEAGVLDRYISKKRENIGEETERLEGATDIGRAIMLDHIGDMHASLGEYGKAIKSYERSDGLHGSRRVKGKIEKVSRLWGSSRVA